MSCMRGRRVNFFGFVRQMTTAAAIPLCRCSMKVAIDNMITRGWSCVPVKLDFPDLACRPWSADGGIVDPGVLVFKLDAAEVFCTVVFPIDSPLHVKEFCVLPSLGFDELFDF